MNQSLFTFSHMQVMVLILVFAQGEGFAEYAAVGLTRSQRDDLRSLIVGAEHAAVDKVNFTGTQNSAVVYVLTTLATLFSFQP